MKLWDLLFAAGIVIIAVSYLYRKLVVNRGCTCGSSSSCAGKTGICCINKKESSE